MKEFPTYYAWKELDEDSDKADAYRELHKAYVRVNHILDAIILAGKSYPS